MRLGTRVTRAGLPQAAQGAPFLPGPTFAGPYHAAGEPASAPLTYGRFHNPTWTLYAQALSELEGGPARTFASGMAAIAAVFGVVLRPGDIVVLPADSYYTTRRRSQGHHEALLNAPQLPRRQRRPEAGQARARTLAAGAYCTFPVQ